MKLMKIMKNKRSGNKMKMSTAEIKMIIKKQISDGKNYTPSDFSELLKATSDKTFTIGQLSGAIKQLADNGDIQKKERGLYCRAEDHMENKKYATQSETKKKQNESLKKTNTKETGARMLEFLPHGDERGHLVVVEGMKDIPFEIKRIFYIYGSDKDVVRGQHANRKTQFVLINVAGTSKVRVDDGKGNETIYSLNRPHTGIYLPTMVWKDMYDFSKDSVLLCLASEPYDAEEYIRDYKEFVEIVNK